MVEEFGVVLGNIGELLILIIIWQLLCSEYPILFMQISFISSKSLPCLGIAGGYRKTL